MRKLSLIIAIIVFVVCVYNYTLAQEQKQEQKQIETKEKVLKNKKRLPLAMKRQKMDANKILPKLNHRIIPPDKRFKKMGIKPKFKNNKPQKINGNMGKVKKIE